MNRIIVTFLKELLLEMIISAILLVCISFIVLRMSPAVAVIKILILIIYGISTFAGGYIIGKIMNRKKIVWGAISGIIYFAVIAIVSFIVKGGIDAGTVSVISSLIVSVAAGSMGGMIS